MAKEKAVQPPDKKKKKEKKPQNPLVIEAPNLQNLKQKYSFSFITFLFWLLWFYLWNPLISLLAWFFGWRVFYDNMILLGGWPGLMEKLNAYAITLLGMAIVFFGWAFYNNARFYNRKRRGKIWKVNTMNLSEEFSITHEEVLTCKSAKRIVINFDPGGQITHLSNEEFEKSEKSE